MTDEMLAQMLSDEVSQHMAVNREEILRALRSVCRQGETLDPKMERLLLTAIHISTQFSAQIITRNLEIAGVVILPPDGEPLIR